MQGVEAGLGLTNYFGMFSGRFGQTGRPTYSNIRVCTDSINIDTYEVSDEGVPSPFDSFKVVKTANSPNGIESHKTENNIGFYPVPVKDYAYISFKDDVKATVEVFSVNGQLLKLSKSMD